MDPLDLGGLGLWIFLAALVVASYWRDTRLKAEKHETLRLIVEKTGAVDEAKLKELFRAPPYVEQKPGSGYRLLRILGTIVMFTGAGVFGFFSLFAGLVVLLGHPLPDVENIVPLFVLGIGIAFLGYGLFFASRFAEPPPSSRDEPPAT
jgi:hypothetical protein